MKRDDDASQGQIQKPVHERAGFPLAAQEYEELRPGLGLQDVRESNGPNAMMARTSTDLSISSSGTSLVPTVTEDGSGPTHRNYRFNVAAYELNTLLGLHLVRRRISIA